MKWLALFLVVAGIVMMATALRSDQTASFDDGSFIWEMLLGGAGALSLIVGLLIFLVDAFTALG